MGSGQGQLIAAIGASGSSLMLHLHFHLQTTSDALEEGLPPSFRNFRRSLGGRFLRVAQGYVDSGDIVQDLDGAAGT
jgi:hypothetical protein